MQTEKTLIGYRVKTKYGAYVMEGGQFGVFAPTPVTCAKALEHASVWAKLHPEANCPQVIKVFKRVPIPTSMEKASGELTDLLFSLTQRHGLDLGITREEAKKQIARELEDFALNGQSY